MRILLGQSKQRSVLEAISKGLDLGLKRKRMPSKHLQSDQASFCRECSAEGKRCAEQSIGLHVTMLESMKAEFDATRQLVVDCDTTEHPYVKEALTPEPLRKTLLKNQQQNGKQNAAEAKAAPDDNRKVIRGWESCKINFIKRCGSSSLRF